MSRPARAIARRCAIVVALVGAFALLLMPATARHSARADAAVRDVAPPDVALADVAVPAAETAPPSPVGARLAESGTPTPTPSAPPPANPPAPPAAHVTLERAGCDSARLSARTDPGVTLSYRLTDDAGNVPSTGTFTGSLDRTVWLSTGHSYTATLSSPGDGSQLASSATVDLRETCPVTVTADPPGFSDPCETGHDAVVVPRIIGVDYRVGDTLLVPGPNRASGLVTVQAVARPGYTLAGPSRWSYEFSADPCVGAPEPSAAVPATAPVDVPDAGPPPAVVPSSPASAATAASPAPQGTAAQREDPALEADRSAAPQASVGGPGPVAWGIMIAVALTGGVVFWLKTRH